MNIRSVVPEWLLDLLMGYLDPAAAHYTHRSDVYEPRQNWLDTFLSPEHLKHSLSQYNVQFTDKRQSRKWKSSCQTEMSDITGNFLLIIFLRFTPDDKIEQCRL